jgi:hypothetical protein
MDFWLILHSLIKSTQPDKPTYRSDFHWKPSQGHMHMHVLKTPLHCSIYLYDWPFFEVHKTDQMLQESEL